MNEENIMLDTVKERRAFTNKVKGGLFSGKNKNGEDVAIFVYKSGMEIKTYQNDHAIRINYYDKQGYDDGERFDGMWED